MSLPSCTMTETQVREAFLAAPPALASSIVDLTIKHPVWLRDLYALEEFPLGQGTVQQTLVMRGRMPKIERGFEQWKKLSNNTGCDPCAGPDCGYNWTNFGGFGMERKLAELGRREFRSPDYCIKDIQSTAHWKTVFAQAIQLLYAQINFFKEINIGQNVLTSLAKKYVVDSGGPKPNPQNPYVYRPVGTVTLSMLNIYLLEAFYEWMRRQTDCIPYEVSDGQPLFAMECSSQLLSHLYRDDPNLRQDVRFSGYANDLVDKYNFTKTIRGMFLPAPILWPRRFNVVAGELVEVFPVVDDIPMEVGSFTGNNPAYEMATYEEVILHGKFPFKILYQPTAESAGENASFGPEFSFLNNWLWVNPMTMEDPFRRLGYYASSATVGVAAEYSDSIIAIAVQRPSILLTAFWTPAPECPPEDPACDNEVAAVSCPCPLIVSATPNPLVPGNIFLTLAVAIQPPPEVDDEIQFGIDTGGYVTGTVVGASDDGFVVEVTFAETGLDICDRFTTVFCDDTLGCSANVLRYGVNCTDATRIDLVLGNNIKAEAGDTITLQYGDGTTVDATVISVDMLNNVYVVDIGGSAFCDNVGGVVSACVPTATDATCPGCDGTTIDSCTT